MAASAVRAETAASPPPAADTLSEVIVTAQKREENIQSVPISVQALNTRVIERMKIQNFEDYAKLLPSVSFQTTAPGQTNVYMRGVATGGDGLAVGSLPSVGTYLDEQPVTTILGALDVHIYDIARIEALAGPQGTLFGASSEAGTLRIITNKPDTSGFSAGYTLQGNTVDHGGQGYLAEGFVNQPVSDKVAIRLVAFDEHDAGYIDSVAETRYYPTAGLTVGNAPYVKKNFNTVDSYGGRAALKIDLNDNWTITPTVMGQEQRTKGVFSYEPAVGDLQVARFGPDYGKDAWMQAALTIQGKIGKFDLTYSGGYMNRRIQMHSDYSDYSYFYDALYGYVHYDNAGDIINPNQELVVDSRYSKQSHELRIQSPASDRLRFTAGLFYQKQINHYQSQYFIQGLSDAESITGQPGVYYLNQQKRIDRDYAAFGEVAYDLTSHLTATLGGRLYRYDNTVTGFFGFKTTEAICFAPSANLSKLPCVNIDKAAKRDGETYRFNLTYKFDPDRMVYFTVSDGYRPGGINRRASLGAYEPDFLTNYELGWKTQWFDHRLRFNGAVYLEDWNNVQFNFSGANGITDILNAGNAQVKGVETDLSWVILHGLTLSGAAAYTDARMLTNYCALKTSNANCSDPGDSILAPKGTQLPVTPQFKGNLTLRYEFDLGPFAAHLQGSVVNQSAARSDLRLLQNAIVGDQRAFTVVDFTSGLARGNTSVELFVKNLLDERAQLYRYTECAATTCGARVYVTPDQPRTIGLELSQKF
ncbi:MAG: TonB-dependent receptor [Caulobacteraceae bacterium]|nr:TonB-dependent receptor [Caulobacteraceae bacterium]